MQQALPARRGRDGSPESGWERSTPGERGDSRCSSTCRSVEQGMTLFHTLRAGSNWPTIEALHPMQAHQRMLDPTPNGLHSGESPLLRTLGLTKRYGDFLANDSIDIDIWPKEIHALLGENGAGKSTLVKAIYGLIQPSAGEIRWQG